MTPIRQGPLSVALGSAALVLAFGAGFLAGLTVGAAVDGRPCANADAARQERIHAATNNRIINPRRTTDCFNEAVYLD
jgi:hypothetical protein